MVFQPFSPNFPVKSDLFPAFPASNYLTFNHMCCTREGDGRKKALKCTRMKDFHYLSEHIHSPRLKKILIYRALKCLRMKDFSKFTKPKYGIKFQPARVNSSRRYEIPAFPAIVAILLCRKCGKISVSTISSC